MSAGDIDYAFLGEEEEEEYEEKGYGDDSPIPGMRAACLDEISSPEILPYKKELVAETKTALEAAEDQIEIMTGERSVDKDGVTITLTSERIIQHIQEMEIERVRYLLVLYHRVRLAKIEKFLLNIDRERISTHSRNEEPSSSLSLPEDAENGGAVGIIGRLSEEEKEFAFKLAHITKHHLASALMNKLPQTYKKLPPEVLVDEGAALDKFVFLSVDEDVHTVQLSKGEYEFRKGDIIMANYSDLKTYVDQQQLSFI